MRFSDFYDKHAVLRFAAAGAAVIVLLSVGLDFMNWGVHRLQTLKPITHLSAPAPKPKPTPAKKTAPAPTSTAAKPKSIHSAASLADAVLPAQAPPARLKAGQVLRQLWVAATPAKIGTPPNWVPIASVWGQASTTSFSTSPPKSLRPLVPTRGLLKNKFSAWVKVPHSGSETLILSLSGVGGGHADLIVDGQPAALLTAYRFCNPFSGCGPAPTVVAASIGLAAGAHQISLVVTSKIDDPPMVATLYGRGPGASAPTEFIPFSGSHGSQK